MTEPDDSSYLSIREAAERGLPLSGEEARKIADALRATERMEEKARDERDSARLQIRLLQRQLRHVQELLSAWQTATTEAVSNMDIDAPSPIPKLLMSMMAASARANQENLADLKETLSHFDEVVKLYDRRSPFEVDSHDQG